MEKSNLNTDETANSNLGAVKCNFSQGDKIKIKTEDFGTIYGEFHRYGASRFGAIIFVNDVMRFIDEQSLSYA